MRNSRASLFGTLAAAALAAGLAPGSVVIAGGGTAASESRDSVSTKATNKATRLPATPSLESIFGRGFPASAGSRTWPGLGWPVAHDRRMARKRRNVLKNRRAQKRAGR